MTTNPFDLTGKIALVTGASRGIGEAIAKTLALAGAEVIVSSRKVDACASVVQEIAAAGGKASALACNIGRMEDIRSTFDHVQSQFGRLDILVNNAAANPYFGHILDTDLGAFEKTVEVNLRGYFFMSVAAGQLMRNQAGGAIVNVASVNALSPGDKQGVYSITKAAVVSMTKAFARECGPLGIRVNALLPGLTRTKFAQALFEQKAATDQLLARIPLGRSAEPNDMAGAVLYLVSNAAQYTTGECLVVDGGITL